LGKGNGGKGAPPGGGKEVSGGFRGGVKGKREISPGSPVRGVSGGFYPKKGKPERARFLKGPPGPGPVRGEKVPFPV